MTLEVASMPSALGTITHPARMAYVSSMLSVLSLVVTTNQRPSNEQFSDKHSLHLGKDVASKWVLCTHYSSARAKRPAWQDAQRFEQGSC